MKIALIRDGLRRGLSPEQIAATTPGLELSASTIYRWVDAGYSDMTNLELRRKVGYRPRRRSAPRRQARRDAARLYERFQKLPEDLRASAWEMDTVEGAKADTACLLTLYHRPTSFQLVLPIADGSCMSVQRGLGLIRKLLGPDGVRRVFRLVLTDNGGEFADETALAKLFGEAPGEVRMFFCEPRRADQKGGCEKNHVEIRKLLPKGKGIRIDRLTRQDCACIMSQINSEPRGKLGFRTPAEMFEAVFDGDAKAITEGLGIESLAPAELDLTPRCIDCARRQRGEAPLTD